MGLVGWAWAEDRDGLLAGLADIADQVEVADPDGDSEKSAVRLRDALSVRLKPAVLVFDNATDPQLVHRYLPSTGAVRVIITSTDRAFGSLGEEVEVGVFDRLESIAYLTKRSRLEDGPGANEVADELDDLPLALAQASTVINLQGLSYAEYVQLLHQLPLERMLPPDSGDAYPQRATARAILLSVQALTDADPSGLTGRVIASAALLASDGISLRVLHTVVDDESGSPQTIRESVARLVQGSLLTWAEDRGSVIMHRLVARAVRDQLQADGTFVAWLEATAAGLRGLLVDAHVAWERPRDSADLVGHALAVWRAAVDATDRKTIVSEQLQAYTDLARWVVRHLDATADLTRAIDAGRSVLADSERALGQDHPDTLGFRDNLAHVYESAGQSDRAIPLYEEILVDRERVLSQDDPDTLGSRTKLAFAYGWAGQHDRAIRLCEEILADRERELGQDHADTLAFRGMLALAYGSAGQHDRAIRLCKEILADRERELSQDHPDTLQSRNNLAHAYESAGQHDKAIRLYKQTVADRERALDQDHPDTLQSRNNLAHAYESAGQHDKAIRLYKQTVADRERALDQDHPDTLQSRNNLAHAYESAGQHDKAIPGLAHARRPRAGAWPRPPRHAPIPQQPRPRLRVSGTARQGDPALRTGTRRL